MEKAEEEGEQDVRDRLKSRKKANGESELSHEMTFIDTRDDKVDRTWELRPTP